jgi:hypothetical protein
MQVFTVTAAYLHCRSHFLKKSRRVHKCCDVGVLNSYQIFWHDQLYYSNFIFSYKFVELSFLILDRKGFLSLPLHWNILTEVLYDTYRLGTYTFVPQFSLSAPFTIKRNKRIRRKIFLIQKYYLQILVGTFRLKSGYLTFAFTFFSTVIQCTNCEN